MLLAGSDDGVYRVDGLREGDRTRAERVLDAGDVYRVRRFAAVDGTFAASGSGLYHSPDGEAWARLPVPEDRVYAVAADPGGDRVYAGTRPARVFVASPDGLHDAGGWTELAGFRALRERTDWGIPRHDGRAQVRSLATTPATPDRLVAGIEVGGVHVSEDGGETWADRHVEGFDAPHTDDIHHVAVAGGDTFVASTGSGLYRSTDAGRSWDRLDAGHRQRYFRAAFVHGGSVYAGSAPAPPSSWEEDTDHALFECHGSGTLDRVESPRPEEVALGWTAVDGDPVTATHRGTLLRRGREGWVEVGSVPTSGSVSGRYLPLLWVGD